MTTKDPPVDAEVLQELQRMAERSTAMNHLLRHHLEEQQLRATAQLVGA